MSEFPITYSFDAQPNASFFYERLFHAVLDETRSLIKWEPGFPQSNLKPAQIDGPKFGSIRSVTLLHLVVNISAETHRITGMEPWGEGWRAVNTPPAPPPPTQDETGNWHGTVHQVAVALDLFFEK
jgi:hypothetical protein